MLTEVGYKSEIVNVAMNENSAEKILQFNDIKCKYIKIGKKKEIVTSQTLEVDTWNTTHDNKDNLTEEEGEKKPMTEVMELKYLGFVIASSASNVPNILDRRRKSMSTPNTIMKMTKGLGTHTLQSGMVYLNSLLRASLLYACEAYVNLSEKEFRLQESTEENCLIKLLDSGIHCPRSILYLEVGHTPARFQIWKLMLNYLQYILKEERNTSIS